MQRTSEFERGNLEPWLTTASPDLATLIKMVLLADTPLFGPPPAEVLDPVPEGDLRRATLESIGVLRADLDADTGNVILTLARIWSSLATGEFRAKDAAADWAIRRLPDEHRPVLDRARAIYLGDGIEGLRGRWDDLADRVAPCADHVIAQIGR